MKKDFYLESIDFTIFSKRRSTYDIKLSQHPFLSRIPKHLYKYRKSGENGRKDFYIKDRNIYTASLGKLNENDAFEGITIATKKRIEQSDGISLYKYYKKHIIAVLREKVPSLDLKSSSTIYDIILEELFDEEAIVCRVLSFVEKSEKKHLRTAIGAISYLFRNIIEDANRNKDFKEGMRLLLNTNELVGAFCMCDSVSNEQLWSLYADNFSGYCIEYDLTNPCKSSGSIKFISNLYPVRYLDKKDDDWFKMLYETTVKTINYQGKANQFEGGIAFNQWMLQVLCTKKVAWSYEKEWRFLGDANKSKKGPLISAVIVGHYINKSDFEEICRYANNSSWELKITDIDYEEQKVIVRDLTDEDISKIMKRL